jgi:hypothetical protein
MSTISRGSCRIVVHRRLVVCMLLANVSVTFGHVCAFKVYTWALRCFVCSKGVEGQAVYVCAGAAN